MLLLLGHRGINDPTFAHTPHLPVGRVTRCLSSPTLYLLACDLYCRAFTQVLLVAVAAFCVVYLLAFSLVPFVIGITPELESSRVSNKSVSMPGRRRRVDGACVADSDDE